MLADEHRFAGLVGHFELLDDDRCVDWDAAQRIAIHALAAWNASKSDAGRLLSSAA